MTRCHRSRGFSLLEVVVAFAILALSLGVLYQIFSSSAQRALRLEAYGNALLLAEAKLASIAAAQPLAPGSVSGDAGGSLRWRGTVEAISREHEGELTRAPHPYRITVEVFWGEGGVAPTVALTTIRLGS